MTPRILVTGGAGFIGSHVVRALAQHHDVVVLDDLSTGSRGTLPNGVRLVEMDISDPSVVAEIEDIEPTAIIHAAAQVSVARSMGDPERDREVNAVGTEHVIEGAKRAAVRRFVFLSSGGAMYGETDGAAETDLARPASYYGIHKWTAERYVELSGLSHAIARIANVYGEGQRADLEGGVIAIFARRLQSNEVITIFGDGQQVRDYLHVDDVARAVRVMVESDRTGTWNVGTGRGTTVNELLARMEELSGVHARSEFLPPRPGDLHSSVLRVELIRAELGWQPQVDLAVGLRSVLTAAVRSI